MFSLVLVVVTLVGREDAAAKTSEDPKVRESEQDKTGKGIRFRAFKMKV